MEYTDSGVGRRITARTMPRIHVNNANEKREKRGKTRLKTTECKRVREYIGIVHWHEALLEHFTFGMHGAYKKKRGRGRGRK